MNAPLNCGANIGGGKSALGALWLLDRATKHPETRWLMGRAKLKTLKETTLNSFFDMAKLVGLGSSQYKYNAHTNIITFNNGSQILLKDLYSYPSDPNHDELGSLEITGAFIDECNQITVKAKNIVKSRIRYKLDEYDLTPKMLLTCNPAKNWVYNEFYKPTRDGDIKKYRKFVPALMDDNPYLTSHYKENLMTLDNVSKERLMLGNWEYEDSPDKLINFDSILDAFSNNHVSEGQYYISADVARLGSDKSVIMVWNGYIVEKIVAIDKNRIDEMADVISNLMIEYKVPKSKVIADSDGVGGGVVDILDVRPFVNGSRALNNENYANLKTQCYYKLALMINNAEIYIKDQRYKDLISEELEWVRSYQIDKDGKLRILPKDKIKEFLGRSPDFADALAFRMYFELVPNYGSYALR